MSIKNPAFELPMSPTNQLLVTAATAKSSEAIAAWSSWSNRQSVAVKAQREERAILPTVAWNLLGHAGEAEIAQATRARQKMATVNLRAVARLQSVFEVLGTNEMPTIVLKGGALLSSACYGDLAARRMSDLDVIVPADKAGAAMALLESRGQVRFESEHVSIRTVLSVMHAAAFQGSLGEVDLHWTLLHHTRSKSADDALFATAVAATLGSLQVLVPEPTQLAFHLLAHGRLPDLRWLVDSHHVIEQSVVDPERLAGIAQQRLYLRIVANNARRLALAIPSDKTEALAKATNALTPRRGDELHMEYSALFDRVPRARALGGFATRQLHARSGVREKAIFLRELSCYASGVQDVGGALSRLAQYATFNRHRPESPRSVQAKARLR